MSFLGYAIVGSIATYLVLIVATVTLASVQTNLSVEVHEAEQDIARLEGRYYAMVSEIDQMDASQLGLVKPERVMYATSAEAPAVTLR